MMLQGNQFYPGAGRTPPHPDRTTSSHEELHTRPILDVRCNGILQLTRVLCPRFPPLTTPSAPRTTLVPDTDSIHLLFSRTR
jgi:hypothetical protein